LTSWRMKGEYTRKGKYDQWYRKETLIMTPAPNELSVDDDGLACPGVGKWAESKYRLISLYDELFATGMKKKWDQRVYIDLYAGAGHSRIRETEIRLKGSPILALTTSCPFDKYIFCEEDDELLDALKTRAKRVAPEARISYVAGSCDEEIERIWGEIPKGSKDNRILSLCLVDPFDFGLDSQPSVDCRSCTLISWCCL